MNVAQIRKLGPLDEFVAAIRELTRAVDALRADLRRHPIRAEPELIAALSEVFGPSRFTVRSISEIIAADPHCALAACVASLIDMNGTARSRATALGALLSRLPEIEVIAEQRGASIYGLRIARLTEL